MQFKRFLVLLGLAIGVIGIHAQTHMRIHHKGGGHSDVPIEQMDSINYERKDNKNILTLRKKLPATPSSVNE